MHSPDHTTWSVPSNTHGHDTNNSNFSDMSKSALGSPIDLICYLTCPSCWHPGEPVCPRRTTASFSLVLSRIFRFYLGMFAIFRNTRVAAVLPSPTYPLLPPFALCQYCLPSARSILMRLLPGATQCFSAYLPSFYRSRRQRHTKCD